MPARSPLLHDHARKLASITTYGPPGIGAEVVQTFGELELEYASLRKHTLLIDAPHRATLEIRGDDRRAFFKNMLTQDLDGMAPGESRRSFWLSRKGRIVADLLLTELGDRTIVDLDLLVAQDARDSLLEYVITEDIEIVDRTDALHRLWLLGPTHALLIDAVGANSTGETSIDGVPVIVTRPPDAALPGVHLTVPADGVETVYNALLAAGSNTEDAPPNERAEAIRLREGGWAAYNTARIESGEPVFLLDFDSSSLPAETGVMDSRVSLTKGCYLGQEVVARMHALGHPKQTLVGVRFGEPGEEPPDPDTALFAVESEGSPVGAVTGSTYAPLLGGAPVGFAMIRWANKAPGTTLWMETDGDRRPATIHDSLVFHEQPG